MPSRKALLLEGNRINLRRYRLESTNDDSPYYNFEKIADDEYNQIIDDWLNRSRREKLSDETFSYLRQNRLTIKANFNKELLAEKLTESKTKKMLSQAKVLKVKSQYSFWGPQQAFEGYIELSDKHWYHLTFYARSFFADLHQYDIDKFINTNSLHGFCVDADKLDENNISRLIQEWYVNKYKYTPGHWTNHPAPQTNKPKVILDLRIEDPEKTLDDLDEELNPKK